MTAIADRLRFFIRRLGERLWVKPLAVALLSIASVVLAELADLVQVNEDFVIPITAASIETLLSIMAASMLVIATFAVSSMVAAYASASSSATPRSFRLVIADDVSQNALSTFIGAFIFSIVALTAVKNDAFEAMGRLAIFVLTVLVFGVVILTFVRWVDRIARLGRLTSTIEKVESAAAAAIDRRSSAPTLHALPAVRSLPHGRAVTANTIGFVQRVDVASLQECAEKAGGWISVATLPGGFARPGRPLAYFGPEGDGSDAAEFDVDKIEGAFVIGTERIFDEDPRFGLIVLSEIADKALSPGINDPGTAIAILGSLVRLFDRWSEQRDGGSTPRFDRVEVPELSLHDMFDDAFTAIARDGASAVEVMIHLQKALGALASLGNPAMREAARAHSRLALARAEKALTLPADLEAVRAAAAWVGPE